jgi:hypothetical protein
MEPFTQLLSESLTSISYIMGNTQPTNKTGRKVVVQVITFRCLTSLQRNQSILVVPDDERLNAHCLPFPLICRNSKMPKRQEFSPSANTSWRNVLLRSLSKWLEPPKMLTFLLWSIIGDGGLTLLLIRSQQNTKYENIGSVQELSHHAE